MTQISKDLEHTIIRGIFHLGWWTHEKRFPGFCDSGYSLTPTVLSTAKQFGKELPNVVEGVADAILRNEFKTESYHITLRKGATVDKAIALLLGIGKSHDEIAARAADSVRGDKDAGAYDTIERYCNMIGGKRELLHGNFPDVADKLYQNLVSIIDPKVVEQAVRELRASYSDAEKLAREIADGSLESGLRMEYIEGKLNKKDKQSIENAKRAIEDACRDECGTRNYAAAEIVRKIPALVHLLEDYESFLGTERFTDLGFGKARESVKSLGDEAELVKSTIYSGLNPIKSRLLAEIQPAKKGWFSR